MTSEAWRLLTFDQQQSMHRLMATINGHRRQVEVRMTASSVSSASAEIRTTQRSSRMPSYRMADQLVVEGMPLPEDLADLYAELRRDRSFAELKRSANFVGGDGPSVKPRAMLIGEAPGAEEDKLRRPFVGRSGNFLESMMTYAGLKRSQCFVTNVVKWRPEGNRTPSREEVELSVPYLRREVMTVLPQGGLVILLGSVPLSAVDQDRRITKVHGKAFPRGIWTFMPMWHPSYVMQNRAPREAYVEDWQAVERYVVK